MMKKIYLLIPVNVASFWGLCWVVSKCGPGEMPFFPGFPLLVTVTLVFVAIIVFTVMVFAKHTRPKL
jgi:FtsH-binding integral membrane protein